jgi:hypothetical protein
MKIRVCIKYKNYTDVSLLKGGGGAYDYERENINFIIMIVNEKMYVCMYVWRFGVFQTAKRSFACMYVCMYVYRYLACSRLLIEVLITRKLFSIKF